MFGRPLCWGTCPVETTTAESVLLKNEMLTYCMKLTYRKSGDKQQQPSLNQGKTLSTISSQVAGSSLRTTEERGGESRRGWDHIRYYLTTKTAVKVAEQAPWIHVTHFNEHPHIKEIKSLEASARTEHLQMFKCLFGRTTPSKLREDFLHFYIKLSVTHIADVRNVLIIIVMLDL
ncbi:hypothetical protein SRHO_G00076870 [Serrasalmus rhombeus]